MHERYLMLNSILQYIGLSITYSNRPLSQPKIIITPSNMSPQQVIEFQAKEMDSEMVERVDGESGRQRENGEPTLHSSSRVK